MKKARPWKQKTPEWVETHPRVIDARKKWERGELSNDRMRRIRRIVAGLCVKCTNVAVARHMCAKHAIAKRKQVKLADKKKRDRVRIEKNARAGVPITMHSVKSCSKCGTLRKTAATCNNGVHR